MSIPDWQSNIQGVLLHPSKPLILLQSELNKWRLPEQLIQKQVRLIRPGLVAASFRASLNLNVRALCPLCFQQNEELRMIDGVFFMEVCEPVETLPAQYRWADRAFIETTSPIDAKLKRTIEDILAMAETGVRPQNWPPWTQPGWHKDVTDWVNTQLESLGATMTGALEQRRISGRTCLLLAPTDRGDFFFKAMAPIPSFAPEAVLMSALNEKIPAHIPKPIAIDSEQGWLLMEDLRPLLKGGISPSELVQAMEIFAQLQINMAGEIDFILDLGCPDRRLSILEPQIEPFIEDPIILSYLGTETINAFIAQLPRLKSLCRELAEFGLPDTLVHGDLFWGNMVVQGNTVLYFDWTDACLGHPFLDIKDVLFEEENLLIRLRESYLKPWKRFADPSELRKAWSIACPLSALHQCIRFQYTISNLKDSPWVDEFNDLKRWVETCLKWIPRT